MAVTVVNRPDLTIYPEPAGSLYAWRVQGLTYVCRFGAIPGYRFESLLGPYTHTWQPDTIGFVDDKNNHDWIMAAPSPVGAIVDGCIVYDAGFAVITFEPQRDRIKQTTILKQALRAPDSTLVNPLTAMLCLTGGITIPAGVNLFAQGQVQTGDFVTYGPIELHDAAGSPVMVFDWITGSDAAGHGTNGAYRILTDASGNRHVYEGVPAMWLAVAQFPVSIDPTTVATSTSSSALGNANGRTEVICANGNIVAFWHNGSAIAYAISSDNGSTFGAATATSLAAPAFKICMDSSDSVYVFTIGGTGASFYIGAPNAGRTSWTFGAANAVSSNTSNSPSCVVLAEGTGWVLHCLWADNVNPNYITTYRKFTIDSTHTMVTAGSASVFGPSNATSMNPDIAQDQTAKHLFIASCPDGLTLSGWKGTYSAGAWTWGSAETVYSGTVSRITSVDCDSQGRFLVAFQDGSGTLRIRQRNTDATYTILDPASVTTFSSPSIACGPGDDVYVFYSATTTKYPTYQKYSRSGAAWSTATIDGTNAATGPVPVHRYSNGGLDALYEYGAASPYTVANFHLSLDQAPTAPTNLSPANGGGIDLAATSNPFSFTSHDPDLTDTVSAYQLQVFDSGNTKVFDSGKITLSPQPTQGVAVNLTVFPGAGTTANTNVYLGSALVNNASYTWKVQTWDAQGVVSPFSASAAFVTRSSPTANITQPVASAVLNTSGLTVAGQYNQSGAGSNYDPIAKLQIILYAADGVTVLKDTGQMTWTNPSVSYDFSTGQSYPLANSTTYVLKMIVTSASGLTGTSAAVTFSTSFVAPAAPTVSTATDSNSGTITVTATNPTPTGGQPTVTSNMVQRSTDGTNWTTIGTVVPAGGPPSTASYTDRAVASGVSYQYRAVAIASSNGATMNGAASVPVSVAFQNIRFTPVDGSAEIRLWFNTRVQGVPERQHHRIQSQSVYRPSYAGPTFAQMVTLVADLVKDDGTQGDNRTVMDYVTLLDNAVRNGTEGYLRTPVGRVHRGILVNPGWEEYYSPSNFTRYTVHFEEKGKVP